MNFTLITMRNKTNDERLKVLRERLEEIKYKKNLANLKIWQKIL